MRNGFALTVEGISKTFRVEDREDVVALAPTDLKVREGEFVSVIGPSGCGKSTLFNIIGGLIDSDTGRVLVDGEPVRGSHHAIGMVFQEDSTFPSRCYGPRETWRGWRSASGWSVRDISYGWSAWTDSSGATRSSYPAA